MSKIDINTDSIKNELKKYKDKPIDSILEYIWNGFDAEADNININYSFSVNAGGLTFGYPKFEIVDDGTGWDLDNTDTTKLFLVSQKKSSPNKSLPQGKDGVGRFTFFSFASGATWETAIGDKKFKLRYSSDSLNQYFLEKIDEEIVLIKGTRVSFDINTSKLNEYFFTNDLKKAIAAEFCWFLKLYPQKNIYLNEEKIEIDNLIYKIDKCDLTLSSNKFDIIYIQWAVKPLREYSKYYFINSNGVEASKKTSGLNNKSDEFFHSVFIRSSFFDSYEFIDNGENDDEDQGSLPIFEEKKKIFKELLLKIKETLELNRKPYLRKISKERVDSWRGDHILPIVDNLGIKQEDYENVIKEIYIVAPQLFTNSNDEQKKFIFNLLSSLLSTEDKNLILKILEQVYKLSEEEKHDLEDLLNRTTLSNIIKTIKEIDHRLYVISCLEKILFGDENQYTLEVEHLQKILDENFWIFGENYRLFTSTEGSIRNTLIKFKNEILRKDDEEVLTTSKKELDLFLTKNEETSGETKSIVIEIKRPSVKLGKKEFDQICNYAKTVTREKSCNGEKISFKFYLIGTDYDRDVVDQIKAMKNNGEELDGLAFIFDDRHKVYIKKWSDIINVEQKSKYKYLQEKLDIEKNDLDGKSAPEIVEEIKSK
ncbi:MAG: ATP-binding protein [Patescibacteria group bacterium]|nr:ATP-binding protein [Patescibacteria group bacterium]